MLVVLIFTTGECRIHSSILRSICVTQGRIRMVMNHSTSILAVNDYYPVITLWSTNLKVENPPLIASGKHGKPTISSCSPSGFPINSW